MNSFYQIKIYIIGGLRHCLGLLLADLIV